MEVWNRIFVLSLGGVLGVNARYWLGVWMNRWTASHWATFIINISGSFLIGFLTMALARWLPHPHVRLAILTGFLGGYTTFSTFAFESVMLWERGERSTAMANMVGSLAAGFLAAALGMILARDVFISIWDRSPAANDMGRTARAASGNERHLAVKDESASDLETPPGAKASETPAATTHGIRQPPR